MDQDPGKWYYLYGSGSATLPWKRDIMRGKHEHTNRKHSESPLSVPRPTTVKTGTDVWRCWVSLTPAVFSKAPPPLPRSLGSPHPPPSIGFCDKWMTVLLNGPWISVSLRKYIHSFPLIHLLIPVDPASYLLYCGYSFVGLIFFGRISMSQLV